MSDRLEVAASGRARCRACGGKIEKGALRFGEELASSYGEGDTPSVYWFHPRCAAHRRPEKFIVVARTDDGAAALPDREALIAEAEVGIAHPRLPRIAGAEPATSGRAHCRHCKELIASGLWRIRLSTFGETGFFDPLGFIHLTCAPGYFDVPFVLERIRQVAPDLGAEAFEALAAAERGPASASTGPDVM